MRKFGATLVAVVALMLGGGAATFGIISAGAVVAPTTFTVNDASDAPLAVPGSTVCESANFVSESETPTCTIRAALEASRNLAADTTINVPDPTLVPNNPNPQYSVFSNLGQLDVNDSTHTVTIAGAGDGIAVIQAQCGECAPTSRVLKVETGTTGVISGVTIEDGHPSGSIGGGILNCGILHLSSSTVRNNTAANSGGGIEQSQGGSTTLDGVSVINNTVSGNGVGGGGIDVVGNGEAASSMTITNSHIDNNTVQSGTGLDDGGGIAIEGSNNAATVVTITNSTVNSNTAPAAGGGVSQVALSTLSITGTVVDGNTASGTAATSDGGGGVALHPGAVGAVDTLTNDTISNNTASQGASGGVGGGLVAYGSAVTANISGTNFTNNSADTNGGGMAIDGPGTFPLSNDTFTGNAADASAQDGEGGGLYVGDVADVTVQGSSFDTNTAYVGGGIAIEDYNTMRIDSTAIASNTGTEGGGGIYDDIQGLPALAVTNSTISTNHASGLRGISVLQGAGGGFLDDFCSPVNLTNDTISGNTASRKGGGFDSEQCNLKASRTANATAAATKAHARAHQIGTSPLEAFLFDTFASNSAGNSDSGGNIAQNDVNSVMTLANSIVAYGIVGPSPTTNCVTNGTNFTSQGHNVIDDTACGTPGPGDIIGRDPLLGALANNGGPTQTQLPGAASPAIGAVPNAICTASGVTVDERGVTRPSGLNGTCTSGAVEVPAVIVTPPIFNPNGYRMAAFDGGVFDFGIAFHGSLANAHLNSPIVGIANNPGPDGYLLVGGDGGVFALGGAPFFGSLGGEKLPSPIAAIAATPNGQGYWLASRTGTVYAFGAAPSLPAVQVPAGHRIVGIASTNDGKGLWLTDDKGDVYTQGDAQYLGSLGALHLNAAIVGIAPAATGQGYILAAADGGVFAFGVGYFGSVPAVLHAGQKLNAPIMGIAETHSGNGYWEVGADGGVFCFGDAPFLGSTYTQLKPGQTLNGPIIGIQHLGVAPPG